MTPSYLRHNADTQAGDSPNILHTSTGMRQLRQNYVYGTWLLSIWDTMHAHTQETARILSTRQQERDNCAKIMYVGRTHSCMRHYTDTHSGDGPNILHTSTGRRQRRPNYVYGTWLIRIWDTMHTHTQEAARTSAARQQGKDESYRIMYMGHDSSVYETHAMQAHTQEAARAFFARQLDEDIGAKTATPTPHQQWERCPK